MINQGKLAVVEGIEVSKLFDCGVFNEQAECTADQIDRRLDEVYAMGVRDMELVNKFDNALAGVAGDNGTTGVAVNNGNKIETGKYWQMQHCDGHNHAHDRSQPTAPGVDRDALAGNILDAFGGGAGTAPVYAAPPHCNARGLTAARRAPGPAHDREGDDHRPRPPERPRAPAAARHRREGELLRDRLEPQLEHPGLDPADLPRRRLRHALRGRLQGLRRARGARSRSCATRATTGASAGART